jgi:hypothetical protein
MRGLGIFIGSNRRNDPIKLHDPHPIPRYEDGTHTGSPAHDGYTLLSRADPKAQGNPPAVDGTVGPVYRGPDETFER